MQRITLINTQHENYGKCNSTELLKIVSKLKPEVLFCEGDHTIYDEFKRHIDKFRNLVEFNCIERYLQSNDAVFKLVDIDVENGLSNEQVNYMLQYFDKYEVYKALEKQHYSLVYLNGFKYINSNECIDLFQTKKQKEIELLEYGGVKKEILNDIYIRFNLEQDIRENAMLNQIYEYSMKHSFDHAVFLLGCGHRNSIIGKIKMLEERNKTKLKWNFDIIGLID